VMRKAVSQQFGTAPGWNTTYALIIMVHQWNVSIPMATVLQPK
jgi:hypothetical protein